MIRVVVSYLSGEVCGSYSSISYNTLLVFFAGVVILCAQDSFIPPSPMECDWACMTAELHRYAKGPSFTQETGPDPLSCA